MKKKKTWQCPKCENFVPYDKPLCQHKILSFPPNAFAGPADQYHRLTAINYHLCLLVQEFQHLNNQRMWDKILLSLDTHSIAYKFVYAAHQIWLEPKQEKNIVKKLLHELG